MTDSPAAGDAACGITPETVPAEWLKAAWDADYAWLRSPDRERGGSWGGVPERQLRRILAAAAPLIAAAEREDIISLASAMRASVPADHPKGAQASFADYLRVTSADGPKGDGGDD